MVLKDGDVEHYDVIIVGCGLSGIGLAYYLQQRTKKTFKMLDRRERFGGTWDFFKYPGLRSDSDMFTYSFAFHPWQKPKHFASAEDILAYLNEVIVKYKLRQHMSFGQYVKEANFSSNDHRWSLKTAEGKVFSCNFLMMCSGYYDYDEPYTPDIKGMNKFKGPLFHSQTWPTDLDHSNKNVVVVGSGATAVTLIPALVKTASHVTMLQRSPSFIAPVPDKRPIGMFMRFAIAIFGKRLKNLYYRFIRIREVFFGLLFFKLCRCFPAFMKKIWLKGLSKKYPDAKDLRHFTPKYNPWEQRVCAAPDGDFYQAYDQGKMSIVTDHIDEITETGIKLRSSPLAGEEKEKKELSADIIVLATGFKMLFGGHINFTVDGMEFDKAKEYIYKGMMLSNVPNLFFAIGYSNASWTLKVDLTGAMISDLLNHMDAKGYSLCKPTLPEGKPMETSYVLDFSSGYNLRSRDFMPKCGTKSPWRLYHNYFLDYFTMRIKSLQDPFMSFSRHAPNKIV